MTIKLNEYNIIGKDFLTKEKIIEEIGDERIFRKYLGDFQIGKVMQSPLKKDKNPSFSIFRPKKYPNRLFFKDFRIGTGDSIMFVYYLLKFDSYYDTLSQIAKDFNIDDKYITSIYTKNADKIEQVKNNIFYTSYDESKAKETVFQIKSRNWKKYDKKYWAQYGITYDILIKFKIKPIVNLFINDSVYSTSKLTYAYPMIDEEGVTRYKIYQPNGEKMKWLNNYLPDTISGYNELPKTGNYLIITKSLKDIMCLNGLGYKNVIAPQSESYNFQDFFIENMKKRFNRIIVFYDFDDAGIENAQKLVNKFNISSINTGSSVLKDISDYYKRYGKYASKQLMQHLLNK